ncbi:MAG TPA: LLM class F420-dependent oxidoreductase [Jatrophihabitans sp.]|nr:LLM class F420-dependent oxidoreductase [Jatrophihabitans sp.]
MELRIFTEPQQGATYADLLRIAQASEDLGFAAFFRSDHYLAMGGDGRPGPSDAWVTLAGLARDTKRIRLGTLVTPTTFRLPGPLAITVAGIDEMSGGRVELGIGAGWFEAEHTAHGIPFPDTRERFDRFVEQVEIIDGLWRTPATSTFSYQGTYYQLADSPALPKPTQSPRPPIILGGAGNRRSATLAAERADEYNVAFRGVADTAAVFDRVRAAAGQTGRSLVYSAAQVVCVGASDAALNQRAAAIGRQLPELRQNGLAGSPAEVIDRIGAFAEAGATRLYLQVLDLTDLDQLELIATQVAPQLG